MVKNGKFNICYWYLVVKNGNWHIYSKICQQIYPLKNGNIVSILWDVFGNHLVVFKKMWTISYCYFWIILVVNSQLAWFSHVRCNPLDTHWHPQEPPKHPYIRMANFNYEGSYLPAVICNIGVKADLGRSPDCCYPHVPRWSSRDGLNSTTPNLADEHTLADRPPGKTSRDGLNMSTDLLGRWTYFASMDLPLHPNAKWQYLTITDI